MVEVEHPHPTQRSEYRYLFSSKHHGGGSSTDACWLPEVTRDEEFGIFDTADLRDLSDERGWLYGVLRASEEGLRELGTWNEQVAEFPVAREGVPWHGYPKWALNGEGPENRRGEDMRPSKEVFRKLEAAGLITKRERKRLQKGKHV